jgi:hypothetical protein
MAELLGTVGTADTNAVDTGSNVCWLYLVATLGAIAGLYACHANRGL